MHEVPRAVPPGPTTDATEETNRPGTQFIPPAALEQRFCLALKSATDHNDPELRQASLAITKLALEQQVTCEQLVIELKRICRTVPSAAGVPFGLPPESLMNQVVSDCIRLYFDPDLSK
jgi:hypothetical protein